jgi:circadian clock protein KaiC
MAKPPEQVSKKSMGIARLEEMMQGGVPAGSTTLLLGASGTGKTLLGSHFLLAGAAQGEPGLYFGFHETPSRLERKLAHFGLDITSAHAQGHLEVLWQSPLQSILDVPAERLLEATRRGRVQRLFIDGVGGFLRAVAAAERLDLFLTALLSELQALEVTTICSVELPALFSPTLELPQAISGIADLADNLLFLRYVELESQLYRLISILKMRESGYDTAIREFRITDQGIDVAPTFVSAQAILTGVALPISRQERSTPFAAETGNVQGRQP